MTKIIKWLDGRKSYIGTTALAVIGSLAAQGVIDLTDKWWATATAIIVALTGVAFRAAITKSGK